MTAGTITPYQPGEQAGRDGFAQVLRAEWTKFRTVRGWVIGMIVAVLVTAGIGLFAAGATSSSCQSTSGSSGGPARSGQGCMTIPPVGPGGEAVSDSFYFVRQPLAGNGSITVQMTSLTGLIPSRNGTGLGTRPGLVPWAKAGIIIKDEHSAGIGVRGDDGHRGPRGAHAGRLHQRHGGPAGRRLPGVPALAAADPLRRHDHRLRLGRRHALDPGRAPSAWPGCRRPSRPGCSPRPRRTRRSPRTSAAEKTGSTPPARPPRSSITSAGRAPGRPAPGPATTSEPPTGPGSAGTTRPAAGSP